MKTSDWRLLKPWLKQLGSYRIQLLLGIALALATASFGVGLLSLSGWFITASALYIGFDIYTPGGGIRFFAIARTVSRYLERLLNHDLVLKLQAHWRVALFRLLQKTPLHKTLTFRVSDTVQQLTRNLSAMDNLFIRLIIPALTFSLATMFLFVFWSFYNVWLSLILVLGATAVVYFSWTLASKSRPLAVKSLRQQQRLRDNAMNFTDSITELSAWGHYDVQSKRILKSAQQLEQLEIEQLKYQQKIQRLIDSVAQIVTLLVLTLTLIQFEQGLIGAAVVVMLVLSAIAWQELAGELPMQWVGYGNTLAAARRLLKSKSAGEHAAAYPLATDTTSNNTAITIKLDNLMVWRQGRPIIKNLSVRFESGLVHWIEGPSGIGKSTLAEVLMGFYPADCMQGEITTHPKTNLLNEAGYLTQETEIFDASVRDNLNPKRLPFLESHYWRVLKQVNLDKKAASLSDKLDALIGSHGVQLSGGEMRRLALARVLLQDKPVIILDEPFAGIERDLVKTILERMVLQSPQKTWIIISHVNIEDIRADIPQGQRIIL